MTTVVKARSSSEFYRVNLDFLSEDIKLYEATLKGDFPKLETSWLEQAYSLPICTLTGFPIKGLNLGKEI